MLDYLTRIMGNSIGKAAVIDFSIQWALWAVASLLKTEKFYDLAGKLFNAQLLLSYATIVDNCLHVHCIG